jgi:phosphate transport system substrate-binding protein
VSRGLVMAASESAGETPPRVRVVAVDGQLPTLDALRAQSYPLMRPMYLVSRGEPRGAARQFVDFVLGPAGQAIVARYHLPVR